MSVKVVAQKSKNKKSQNTTTFDWLISPLTTEKFFETYFEKKHLRIHRNDANYNAHLLSIELVDQFIYSQILKYPAVRMTNSKVEIPADKYVVGDRIIPSLVLKNFIEGSTLILAGLHECMPQIGEFCNLLTSETGHKFQTNIYITPKESRGFNVHYDTHDVFVIQVSGRKTWRIYDENPLELPNKMQEFSKDIHQHGPLLEEFVLNAGDMLYIPRGIMHDADTLDETSMHITLGMLGFTWTDLLIEGILSLSKQDPKLRKFIPSDSVLNKEVPESTQIEFSNLLKHVVSTLSLGKMISNQKNELIKTQKTNLPGLLSTSNLINHVSDKSKFKLIDTIIVSQTETKANVTLEWSGKKVEFPIFVLPAISFIRDRKNKIFTLTDLPDCTDEPGKIALLKRLAKEGLLEILN